MCPLGAMSENGVEHFTPLMLDATKPGSRPHNRTTVLRDRCSLPCVRVRVTGHTLVRRKVWSTRGGACEHTSAWVPRVGLGVRRHLEQLGTFIGRHVDSTFFLASQPGERSLALARHGWAEGRDEGNRPRQPRSRRPCPCCQGKSGVEPCSEAFS